MADLIFFFDGSALGRWQDKSWAAKRNTGRSLLHHARRFINVPQDDRARLLLVADEAPRLTLCAARLVELDPNPIARLHGIATPIQRIKLWEWVPCEHRPEVPQFSGELPEGLRKLWRFIPGVQRGNPPSTQGSLF